MSAALAAPPEPAELPPIAPTGDQQADDELQLLRSSTQSIHEAQDRVAELSAERQRLVLALRRRAVPFRVIAEAVPTTEQTVYKIHREAKEALEKAHAAGDHSFCQAGGGCR